jgi:hypothetical protein
MEVRLIASITSKETTKFIDHPPLWVSNRIITDLGPTFTRAECWDFCQDSLIDVYYSSVAHPRGNG